MGNVLTAKEGQQFGRLTVTDPETRKNNRRAALCQCSCGAQDVLVYLSHLSSGRVRSCGCIKREQTAERNRRTASRGGLTRHPLFSHWAAAMNRCYNPAAANYRWYGGRGVKVCDEWHDASAFITYVERELGPRPDGCTIDRRDNNGNYEPGNIRWATAREQAQNRRQRWQG